MARKKNDTVKVYRKMIFIKQLKKDKKKIKVKIIYDGPIEAPIKKDQGLAKIKVIYDDEDLIGEYELLAFNDVKKVNIF